ncbi:snoRNA-binding rRNA-processing protein [Allomyces javanicus]|nr:snoRNA-binding rRNA-processing protein [Allomyces javanicus]
MGKEKSLPKFAAKKQRHDPLHKQILRDTVVESKVKAAAKGKRKNDDDMDDDETFLDAKTSKKILDIAQEQQRELEEDEMQAQRPSADRAPLKTSVFGTAAMASDSDSDDQDAMSQMGDTEANWDGGNDDILDVDASELAVLEKFFPQQPKTRQTLADIIAEKIAAFEADAEQRSARPAAIDSPDFMNPKVMSVYSKVGKLLSRYKSGKLPKAFKIIPSLSNWEEVLYITRPDQWTPHAMYEATKIFVSSFNPKMAQRFLNLFLLERVREDIQSTKKLNYHLYMALKKSLYKPAAFFKGILLPLCDDNCSLREAAIVGSVVSKISVPVLHSSAALMKLAEMEYSGATSLFLRILLDKKYALPYKVVDAIVFHFLRFKTDARDLPVLWHQALLVFVQRYKIDITTEQKDALLDLIKFKGHYAITPEIRRELANSTPRGGGVSALASMDVEMVDV